jgi:hypothetical protein
MLQKGKGVYAFIKTKGRRWYNKNVGWYILSYNGKEKTIFWIYTAAIKDAMYFANIEIIMKIKKKNRHKIQLFNDGFYWFIEMCQK